MPRKKLTTEEICAFRARAIDVAEHLFATKGIDGVTLRSIASELGCSPMAPYRYFENREALVSSLRAAAFARLADDQQKAASKAGSALTRIDELGRSYVQFAQREPNAYRLMFALDPPRQRDAELETQARRAFSHLATAIEEAVGNGDLEGDPLTLAHLVWAQVHGIVTLHVAGKLVFGRSIEELAGHSFWRTVRRE